MKITLYAQLSETSLGFIDIKNLADPKKLADHITFFTSDMSNLGYVTIGTVEVDVELLPPDQIIGNAIVALRAKAAGIRAKAMAEATQLEGKAQQLLAIENGI